MDKQYNRDKRSPKSSSETVSKIMSSIRAKDTKPELLMRKALWKKGLKGYRLHYKIQGRPDIVFPKKKVAIFVHGCYWHRCPKCDLPTPKSNKEFWAAKFLRNVGRDKAKESELRETGWTVIVVWECDIKHNLDQLVKEIYTNMPTVEKKHVE